MPAEADPRNEDNARSRRETLAHLRQLYPTSPFLALGQSVFWDEPVKAALLRLLEAENLGGTMTVGVHDTDYFAKANLRATDSEHPFALIPHNGGSTRDLWSAAGEVSTLFGSETFPTRQDFVKHGIGFERAVKASGKTRQKFLDETTEAWGWRGLVYTGSRDLIVSQLPLREVGRGIQDAIKWAFDETLEQIASGCCHDEAKRTAEDLLARVTDYCGANPDASLSDLFQNLLPQFHTLLLGETPQNIEVTATSKLLQFTPETAHLPRFRFVEHFLNPATRDLALDAYNEVMDGSGMYTLDRFGENALPFDIVIPERGRGTLRVTPKVLFVETKKPVAIPLTEPVHTLSQLATALHSRFGDNVTLVGKAVSLVSMLAQEFIFVFNEEGSMYVSRTKKMNDRLRDAGIELEMRPILRLKYETWDALNEVHTTLKPTEYLAQSLGQKTLTAGQFAYSWRETIEEQKALLALVPTLRKPRALLGFLKTRDVATDWEAKADAYETAQTELKILRADGETLQTEVNALYAELKAVKGQLAGCKIEGKDLLLAKRRNLLNKIFRKKTERLALERGEVATQARKTADGILDDIELARVRLIRNALLTIEGLQHTQHRPRSGGFRSWMGVVTGIAASSRQRNCTRKPSKFSQC